MGKGFKGLDQCTLAFNMVVDKRIICSRILDVVSYYAQHILVPLMAHVAAKELT